ncbi:TRAP-type mannitol/chloroaromatic compound transport system, substrate-binding protein [Tistlia consotensis]|uniref:TRAP-type mannitol/chloroaromatic compound transport system, substrate-binding protein n=1 Tax=Tistlia consotensis USBA 355 TaxID=560819 RepID=A0A1Y6C9W4_9PROT|nr:TRAP transporter substrate-binding protein [Tistlia consotensis]SMF44120.1 TRAP-type mannitol/chloroaromatic compound transport system, substrate-binding protein [Tistlia consotensis USBA 355]SNR43093.1 TRAP-type mannitol/chloroaromatic compound transport system, substrate-binding protein [Tistlia consotensis]
MPRSDRRRFLRAAGVGLAGGAAAGLARPALAQQRFELKMVTAWPKNAPGVGVNAERFAEKLRVLSGGRLDVKVFAAGELVPPFEAFDAVASGTADMAHATPYYWVGKSPALNWFTGVPFGMTAVEAYAWLRFGGGQALWDEVYDGFGIKPYYAGSSGTQAGGWFNRKIETVEDFKGLKFRIAGLGGEVMRRLGAATVMMPPGEITQALAAGTVDGADWVGPWNDLAFGLYRFAKYYYMPGFHEPGPGLEVIVNKKVLAGLPDDLKAMIAVAADATAIETLGDFTYHNVVSLKVLTDEHGVQVLTFPDPVVKRLKEVSDQVLKELATHDRLTLKVAESYGDFLTQATAYAPLAEQGILTWRQM